MSPWGQNDEITYPISTAAAIEIYFLPTLYWACDYLSMLGLKLIHISKEATGINFTNYD